MGCQCEVWLEREGKQTGIDWEPPIGEEKRKAQFVLKSYAHRKAW